MKGENILISEHALFAGNTGARTFACNEMTGLIIPPHSSSSDSLIIQNNNLESKKKDKVNVTNTNKRCETGQEKVNQNKSKGKIDNNGEKMDERQKDEEEKDGVGGEEEEQEEGGGEQFITVDELRQMTPWSYQVGRSVTWPVGRPVS